MPQVPRPFGRSGDLVTALAMATSAGLLCAGCAAAADRSVSTRAASADCDFRAPTSCWTLGPRFPESRAQPADSLSPEPPPQVLVEASP